MAKKRVIKRRPAKPPRVRLGMVQAMKLGQLIERNADRLAGKSYDEMREILRPLVDFEFSDSSLAGFCRELGIPSSRQRDNGNDALYERISRLEGRVETLTAEVESLK